MSDSPKKNQKKAPGRQSRRRSGFFDAAADPTQDLEKYLLKGEEVLVQGHIHRAIYWKAIAVLVLGVLVGFLVAKELGILLVVVSIFMGIHAMALRIVLLIAVTNRRILARYGLLQVDVVDLPFSKIESIELERMLLGMILGYATVVVQGTGNRYIPIPYVANGDAIRNAYNEIQYAEDEEPADPKESGGNET